jgi:hypothetical protein
VQRSCPILECVLREFTGRIGYLRLRPHLQAARAIFERDHLPCPI